MIPYTKTIKVTNRDSGSVSYVVPDMGNLRRRFSPGETKDIVFEELRKVVNHEGGRRLVQDCLLIQDKEAVRELLGEVEPEYSYTEADIEKLLLEGSYEQLLDCLDYAPEGVIDLLKNKAVALKVNDLRKREAIQKKTGLDITSAIRINDLTDEVDVSINDQKARRATPITGDADKTEKKSRRTKTTNTSKYIILE